MFHYWNPKLLNLEIQRCGYTFSASSYVKYLLAVYLGIAGFAYLFQLQIFFSVIVMAAASIFVPTVFLMNYKNLYEEKKFEDLTAYMEQLLYPDFSAGRSFLSLRYIPHLCTRLPLSP